jgi:hypothetical protein
VASPNSVLEPGEGARIGINLFATRNGVDAIGQTTAYTPPPPPGVGTIRGITAFNYGLTGDENAATAFGSWSNRAIIPVLQTGSFLGVVTNNGASVQEFGGAQFVPAGHTADGTNPITDAFRGVWEPVNYAARTVHFRVWTMVQVNQQNPVMVQYGTAYLDPSDPTTAYALYLNKYISTNFGSGFNIAIAPAQAAGSLLAAAGGFMSCRRRRR